MENIKALVPAAFSTEKAPIRSNKYNFISTKEIINVLQDNNWFPDVVSQTRVQKRHLERVNFVKHMITFQNPNVETINKSIPQIVIVNSHDGSTPFKMFAGLFRIICSNGLIVSSNEFSSISIRHSSLAPELIENGVEEIVHIVPEIAAKANVMENIKISVVDQLDLCGNIIKSIWKEQKNCPFEAAQLLQLRRNEDKESTLWNTFNVIQENLIKGGIIGTTATNKKRKFKGITNIDKNISINQKIWKEAEKFALAA